jgi:CHASE2 domain-containing sensor protein
MPADSRKPVPVSRAAWLDFGMGLALTAVLIVLKIVFEHSAFGQQVELIALNLQQLRLGWAAGNQLPVTVVDISKLPRIPRTAAAGAEIVTDRKAVLKVVRKIAEQSPAAIGIDVLLDPPAEAPGLTGDEAELLEFCLAVQNLRGERIPTFVGIFDGVVKGPSQWLGDERFGHLGAYTVVPRPAEHPVTTSMIRGIEIKVGSTTIQARSMAEALAAAHAVQETTRRWLGRALHVVFPFFLERERDVKEDLFTTREFAIDFGSLPGLKDTTVPDLAAEAAGLDEAIQGARDRLKGKIVLVGRARTGETTDTFTVPAQAEPVTGVYVHAAATYTLVKAPLFKLTPLGRIAADIAAALVPLGVVLMVRLKSSRRHADAAADHRLARWLTRGTAALVFAFGYFWVAFTGILWIDYLLVIAALLLHGPLERSWAAVTRVRQGRPATAERGHS